MNAAACFFLERGIIYLTASLVPGKIILDLSRGTDTIVLRPCKERYQEISTRATHCLHCGAKPCRTIAIAMVKDVTYVAITDVQTSQEGEPGSAGSDTHRSRLTRGSAGLIYQTTRAAHVAGGRPLPGSSFLPIRSSLPGLVSAESTGGRPVAVDPDWPLEGKGL